MKNLVILMLVLSVTSVASATLSLSVSGTVSVDQGNTLTIGVISDNTSAWLHGIYLDCTSMGALSNAVSYLPASPHGGGGTAGNLGKNSPYSYSSWGAGFVLTTGSTNSPTDVVAGVQHTVDWDTSSLTTGDTATIFLYNSAASTTVASAVLEVVPEPVTIALLGLGGLLLRRRK